MNRIVVIQWLISFSHAIRIIKKLGVKKHRALGFSYDLTELGCSIHARELFRRLPKLRNKDNETLRMYGDYPGDTMGWHLVVYRDLPADVNTLNQTGTGDETLRLLNLRQA